MLQDFTGLCLPFEDSLFASAALFVTLCCRCVERVSHNACNPGNLENLENPAS